MSMSNSQSIEALYHKFVDAGYRVSTDSRNVGQGELFFALKGDNFDGNAYALKALENGASYAVVSDQKLLGVDDRLLLFKNTLVTLQKLARYHRRQLTMPIVALSGTNGKTTTKELIRVALEQKFDKVACTKGNLNNHIGVPLTLLSFRDDDEVGIVEMGANHIGEIAQLCEIAEPNIGLLTNVGRAHLEGFGSFEGVKQTKGELYDWLSTDSGRVALYNNDDKELNEMVAQRIALKSVPYSGAKGIGKELKLFGSYNQFNAAAALAVATYFGAEMERVIEALSNYESTNNRSEVIEKTPKGNSLVVDCYNANPSSMEAAITEFTSGGNIQSTQRPKVMILGAMRELGKYSSVEHAKLVKMAGEATRTYFVGEEFNGIASEGAIYLNAQILREELTLNPITDSEVLIKGSRGNALESILNLL